MGTIARSTFFAQLSSPAIKTPIQTGEQSTDPHRMEQYAEFKAALTHSDFQEARRVDEKYHFNRYEKLAVCREVWTANKLYTTDESCDP